MCGLVAVRDNPVGVRGREPEVGALRSQSRGCPIHKTASARRLPVITSLSPYANAEEDIHDSRLETNNS